MKPEIRAVKPSDAVALQNFFSAMSAQDRTFFFWDVDDPAFAESWANDPRRRGHVALTPEGEIAAFAALQPGSDWSSHVADLVLAVGSTHRRKGLGKALARAMLLEALAAGFRKVTVAIAADSSGPVEMFRTLGFEGEALLRDQLCSPEDGSLRDVIVLAHLVDETWASMRSGGFEEALG